MSKPDQYHDCGHRLRCNDKRKRVQETHEPVVKESLTAQCDTKTRKVKDIINEIDAKRAFEKLDAEIMSTSKTPRTDAAALRAREFLANGGDFVLLADARQLEAELAGANERIDWLSGQREIEREQKDNALNESRELLNERDQLRAQVERLRVCLSSMVSIANLDEWHLATTGRQIVVKESKEALESTKPSVGGEG